MRIGSSRCNGSPGKYICVTRRSGSDVVSTEKWMCAGRQALRWFCHGYAPGLIVTKRKAPSSPVRQRPAPEKFGSMGAGWLSARCA